MSTSSPWTSVLIDTMSLTITPQRIARGHRDGADLCMPADTSTMLNYRSCSNQSTQLPPAKRSGPPVCAVGHRSHAAGEGNCGIQQELHLARVAQAQHTVAFLQRYHQSDGITIWAEASLSKIGPIHGDAEPG